MAGYDDEQDDADRCGCKWVINHGMRFIVERCEEHEALYQEAEKLRVAKRELEKNSQLHRGDEDEDDDIPF